MNVERLHIYVERILNILLYILYTTLRESYYVIRNEIL